MDSNTLSANQYIEIFKREFPNIEFKLTENIIKNE